MANYWYLSNPVTNIDHYHHQYFQELIYNNVKMGYISSYDNGIQHHYCITENHELITLSGSIEEYFTGNSIYIP